MKLLRHGPAGEEKPGLLDASGGLRDLSGMVPDIAGEVLSPTGLDRLRALDPTSLPLITEPRRLGPPVGGVGKILGIGWNYADHAAEAGAESPAEPLVFSKAVSCLAGAGDTLILPRGSTHTDHEVELAVIIGQRAQYVEEAKALDVVAGYAVMNDISERHYQKERGGQFVKGKSFDGFGPLGPWLVTTDEVLDPQNLDLWLDLDGERRQSGNTGQMTFGAAFLVHYVSQFMTLMPGDVITTGTPPGVGWGRDPKSFLRDSQVMRLGVEGLGEQHTRVCAWPGDG